jgi:hypothetical protein
VYAPTIIDNGEKVCFHTGQLINVPGKQRLAAAPHIFFNISFYIYVIQRRNVVR